MGRLWYFVVTNWYLAESHLLSVVYLGINPLTFQIFTRISSHHPPLQVSSPYQAKGIKCERELSLFASSLSLFASISIADGHKTSKNHGKTQKDKYCQAIYQFANLFAQGGVRGWVLEVARNKALLSGMFPCRSSRLAPYPSRSPPGSPVWSGLP